MLNFIKLVNNILEEQGKTPQNLFEQNIVSRNTFYKYTTREPSLTTLINIANYLQVSIDYLLEISDENKFIPYCYNSGIFYDNLNNFLKNKKLSGRKFCKLMNYSRDNINRWKNGTHPTIQTLLDISKFFDCTIDDLLLK